MRIPIYLLPALLIRQYAIAACISSGDQSTINNALSTGGAGAIVQLCAGVTIKITDSIKFTAENQEISTQGYPTGSTRALVQIASGSSTSTLISGAGLNGIRILNIQVDGNRPNAGYLHGGKKVSYMISCIIGMLKILFRWSEYRNRRQKQWSSCEKCQFQKPTWMELPSCH
jgi:hypothetical protein